MSKKQPTSKRGKNGSAKSTPATEPDEDEAETIDNSVGPTPEFATARDFAKAIAQKRNLVEVASALLGSKEVKGASVRARMFETTLEYLFGKPAVEAPPAELPVRVVWDIPTNSPDETPE